MGESFSVDDKLKDTPNDPRYIFWAIQHDDYKAFRRAISMNEFKSNPNIIYEGEGKQVEWKFNALIHCCYEKRVKMASDLMNEFSDILDVNYKSSNDHEWSALHWAVEKNNERMIDILLKHDGIDHNTIYDNKGRSAMDLSEDRQYWNLNMLFILRDLTEGKQSLVKSEQQRHEEEDAVGKYVADLLNIKNESFIYTQKEVNIFKNILFEICKQCILNRKPIDSTLYIMAYEICNNSEKNKFCDIILNTVDQILDNKSSNKLHQAWLKKYLLPCCIWQKKYYQPETTISDGDNTTISDAVDAVDAVQHNQEIKRLQIENKRLKKIISDIRNLTNYELDDDSNLVEDILDEIDENDEKDADNTTDGKSQQKIEPTKQGKSTKDENDKKDEGSNEDEKKDGFSIDVEGKAIFDSFVKKFDNKQPEYAKELMYFSRTVKEYENLTLKQAQDTYLKFGKGGFKYVSDEDEAKRIENEIERPLMFEKLLEITRNRDGEESMNLKANLTKYVNDKENGLDIIKAIKDYKLPPSSSGSSVSSGSSGGGKKKIIVRQDSTDLIPNSVLIANEDKTELQQLSNEEVGFDAAAYYSRYIYTNQLLLVSNQLNEAYQNTISDIFEYINPNKDKVKVLPGPVKKASRIIEKSETKYRNQSFPVAAKVLDTLRCSVVFNEPKDLSNGIKWFVQYINNQNNDGDDKKEEKTEKLGYYKGAKGKILSIVRSKNMFTDPEVNWSMESPGYADLKYNVLFQFDDRCIITEIQFLIQEMMNTKKKIHGFYSILRYEDIFKVLHINMASITPQRKFASLVRAKKENLNINAIKDLMISFGFHGSNILIDDNWMRFGLHFSAEYGTHELTKLFLMPQDVNVNIKDRFGQTPLNQACYANDIKTIKMLLNHQNINVKQLNNEGQEAIHFQHPGNGYKNIEILKLLLNKGCNPCIQDKSEDKMNTLHRLCEASKNDEFIDNIKIIIDIKSHYLYDLKKLKQALNTKDAKGNKPIDYANDKEKNNQKIQKLLTQI